MKRQNIRCLYVEEYAEIVSSPTDTAIISPARAKITR